MRVVAIDQGTTSTKAWIVDSEGRMSAGGSLAHRQILPQPGWVEHDAEELLANVRSLLDRNAETDGIAIANQGETVVAWDRDSGRPLHHAIVWQDQRTAADVGRLKAAGGESLTSERAGLLLDPYFSASKIAWLLESCAEVRQLAMAGRLGIGTTDAYFIERLTGRYATDATTASRTSLMNLSSLTWDEELCRLFGVPIELLPEIVPCNGPFGGVAVGGRSIPLRLSIVDQPASLFGHGCRAAGDTKVTLGTGAFALAVTGSERPSARPGGLLPTLAWQLGDDRRTYALDGGVYSAGSAVEWLLRIGLLSDVGELEHLSGEPAVDRGLVFVPALSGLACPHWDRSAAGLWIGIDTATGRSDLQKAVLEGIALRIAEVIDAIDGAAPSASSISLDGGLARSRYMVAFLADILERPVVVRGNADLTALGAGWLALAAADEIRMTDHPRELGREATEVAPRANGLTAARRARFAEARERSRAWRPGD